MIKLPGLIDVHVHLREPGETHKEDFSSGTAAALKGGITTVLAMPNTNPPLLERDSFNAAAELARQKAYCDYGIYLGASQDNARAAAALADQAAGLKLYLDNTYGPLLLSDLSAWIAHFESWPRTRPLAAHAEGKTLAAFLLLADLYQRPVHVCHVSRKTEILLIREAKHKGIPVTCEAAPHHLFLTAAEGRLLPGGRARVSPSLGTEEDRQALWDNLEYIDCFASDHAPHTTQEKDSDQPPPGFPGLETSLPLLLSAVREGQLEVEDIVQRMYHNPRRIFSIPEQAETWVEVDENHRFQIKGQDLFTRAKWTPFEGREAAGRVNKVVIRGQTVYQEGEILAAPGFGQDIRQGR